LLHYAGNLTNPDQLCQVEQGEPPLLLQFYGGPAHGEEHDFGN